MGLLARKMKLQQPVVNIRLCVHTYVYVYTNTPMHQYNMYTVCQFIHQVLSLENVHIKVSVVPVFCTYILIYVHKTR